MIQPSFTDFFGTDEPAAAPKQNPVQVMQELTRQPCQDCRLGLEFNPGNPGFIWYGNPDGHIVILGDAPSAGDMSARRAFADDAGTELFGWLHQAGVPKEDIFFTNLVQCKTPVQHSKIEARDGKQRVPHWQEISSCLTNRALRVIRALPCCEVVCLVGVNVWAAVLGGDPGTKSHMGFWFGSDLFPGKAIFCLPHPREFDKETSQVKRDRLRQCLLYFVNEYYGRMEDKKILCPPKKVLTILAHREQERSQVKAAFNLFNL